MKLSFVAPLALTAMLLPSCQQNLPTALPSSPTVALSSSAVTSPQRPDLIDLGDTQTVEFFSAEESLALKPLMAQAEAKIAEEDAQTAKNDSDFSVQSADQGKDIDIELFLYHPKYGKKAKSWGIDNAHDFLQAGRSPWRRWLLRLKLEGLFAPKDFSRQLLFWVEQADFLRLRDVGTDQAWLLVASGVTSVPDLARRTPFELGAMVVSMQITGLTYGIDAPSLNELKNWVQEAQALQPVIY